MTFYGIHEPLCDFLEPLCDFFEPLCDYMEPLCDFVRNPYVTFYGIHTSKKAIKSHIGVPVKSHKGSTEDFQITN